LWGNFNMSQKKGKKNRRWWKILGIFALLLVAGVGAYAYTLYTSLEKTVETMHKPIARMKSEKRDEQVTIEKKQPFSVLLLGVDERKGDIGRSDTIIVLTVNPTQNSVKMLSIPRDTRTMIVGKGKESKINHAYAYGGAEMSINTVENFLDIPIDYYIKINMEGFKDIVDAVGGVTVQNDLDFTYEGAHFQKGTLTLDGAKALKYARMRKEDPRGDYGRQIRQRQIIQAVIREGASFSSLTNYQEIFSALGKNVQTDILFSEMMDIQKNYKGASKNIQQLTISGHGEKIGGTYYLVVDDDEKQKLRDELRNHLELKTYVGHKGF
jgi:polyisoprenyl-teichoic acid--peptidoglycan teichoic acid transferase